MNRTPLAFVLAILTACSVDPSTPEKTDNARQAVVPGGFIRGDVNMNGGRDAADTYILLDHINGLGMLPCEDAGDVNDDGVIEMDDAFALLDILFGGATPLEPADAPGPDPTPDALGCAGTPAPDVDPSALVAVRDAEVMARFSFEAVMQKIIDTSNHTYGTDPLDFYQTWWSAFSSQCTMQLNGWDTTCSDAELGLQENDPFTDPDSPDGYVPAALFNRFDLAPSDGSDCGEQRIVFGKRSGLTVPFDRNMIIFEARLPNPTPGDLAGCTPLVAAWQQAADAATLEQRADILEALYFSDDHLPDFPAVLDAANFRDGRGQVRTNTRLLFEDDWVLRQFQLKTICIGQTALCIEYLFQTPTADVPHPSLVDGTSPLGGAFQLEFLARVEPLAADANAPLEWPTTYIGPESRVDPSFNYTALMSETFASNINTVLASIGSTLTADDVMNRQMGQTCHGCHNMTANVDLGGGESGAASLGFQHVDEHGNMSHGLLTRFLPERQALVEAFLD